MLTLNKRYLRSVKKNFSFYLLSALLTAVAICLFLCFHAGVNGEKAYIDEFRDTSFVEDGEFTLPVSLTDDDISDMENDNDVIIEKNRFVNYEGEKYNIRCFTKTEKVNIYRVIEGNDAVNNDEVLLSINFARANSINISDKITLFDKEFTVTGFVERPDYLFMLENLADSYHNDADFGISVMSDEAFESLDVPYSEYYSVIYPENVNVNDFRKNLYDDYGTLTYTPADINRRVTMPPNLCEQLGMYANMILPVIMLIVIILTAVVLKRHLLNDSKQIGVLLALGIKKSQIFRHYMVFALIPAIFGSVFGIVISLFVKDSVASVCFFKLESLPVEYNFNLSDLLVSLLLPALLYCGFALFQTVKITRKNVTALLRNRTDSERNNRKASSSVKTPVRRKFIFRTIFRHFSRTLAFAAGVIISGIVMVYALYVIDSCTHYRDHAVGIVGDFDYEYFLSNFTDDELPDNASGSVGLIFEVEGASGTLNVIGTEDNKYLNFKDEYGNDADLDDGKYYLSKMASLQYGVGEGEKLSFYQSASMKEYEVTIDRIIDNDVQCVLYSSKENICDMFDIPDGLYNVVMSREKISYDEDEVSSTVTKTSLRDQIQSVIDGIIPTMTSTVVIGCIICIIVIYLMVNMLVQENSGMISMLKILGMKNREINKMVLNVYFYILIISSVLGLYLGYLFSDFYFKANVESFQCYISAWISPVSIVIYFGCILVSYFISMLLLRRKVDKVDTGESLKYNQD
ncbi:MAG: ABC transporter permease [Ruminococcus sp.]|nr:ABC transporter permease [Ruminococcus sp.]